MITTHSSQARLSCRAVRLWASLTESEPRRHLQHCAACRAHFAASVKLEQGLRRAAGQVRPVAPLELERDVLRALADDRAGEANEGRGTHPVRRPHWIAAGAALGVAAALAIVVVRREPAAGAAVSAGGIASEDVTALVDSAAEWSDRWWNSVVPSTATAIQDNALQQEVASVYAAAESALDFLALNFLPPRPREKDPAGSAPVRTRSI